MKEKGLLRTVTMVDFKNLMGAFGNKKAAPVDLDGVLHVPGILERCGQFLVMECKHSGDPSLSLGQRILLNQLAKIPQFTVLIVMLSGDRYEIDTDCPGPLKFEPIQYMLVGRDKAWQPTNLESFRRMTMAWWKKVDRKRQ